MPVDTTVFDNAIIAKEATIITAQSDVDNDATIAANKAAQAKAQKLADEQNAKSDIENKKAQFVSIQTEIDTKTAEIAALEQQKKDLVNSIK